MLARRKSWLTFIAFMVAVCVISSSILLPRIGKTEFHGDESGWISSAYYYSELLMKHDFDAQKWECESCGPWGSLNMQLGKWLIGTSLLLDPDTRRGNFHRLYSFGNSFEQNVQEGRVPPPDILRRARSSSAAFGVLCSLLVFAIGYFVYNAWVGFTASVLLLTNEQFVHYATRAMTDVHYNFFLLGFCLALVLFSKVGTRKQAILIGSLCGILGGLASSVKITGIVISILVFTGTAIVLFHRKKLHFKEISMACGSFVFSALIIIYGLNPYLWVSWKDFQAKHVVREIKVISDDFKKGEFQFNGARERYPRIYTLLKFPLMFPRWNRLMESQEDFLSSRWGGNRFLSIHKRLFLEYASFPFEWVFFGIGIVLYFPYLRKSHAARFIPENETWHIPLIYFFANYLFILFFMKLNWARYYLPTIISTRQMIALGLCVTMAHLYFQIAHTRDAKP